MTARPDWNDWLRRWDEQQESFNPERERRFSAMLDAVAATQPRSFRVLDLGSGPGSLSLRILRRFPKAKVVAIDYDPVALHVGEGALGSYRGRLAWVDAQLGAPGWTRALPPGRFDAAVSTTALHWLTSRPLRSLYRDLGRLLRPGGIFLNGDHLPWGPASSELSRLAARVRKVRYPAATRRSEWAAWERWWASAEKVEELRPLFRLREARRSHHPKEGAVALDAQVRALRAARFRTVGVVWQDFENRVLLAVR